MNEKTAQKIMADPRFDPTTFFDKALEVFVKTKPRTLAGLSGVALEYLIADSTEVCSMVRNGLVDVSNEIHVDNFMKALAGVTWYQREAMETFTKLMLNSDSDYAFNAWLENIKVFDFMQHPKWYRQWHNILKNQNAIKPVMEKLDEYVSQNWEVESIELLLESGTEGRSLIAKWLPHAEIHPWSARYWKRENVTRNEFQIISMACQIEKDNPEFLQEMIEACNAKWEAHVCFNCGGGCGFNTKSEKSRNNIIKSVSGYTLHRKKCDPDNLYPSPWEIATGEPRKLEFKCWKCGLVCSTQSGLTLHYKKCY